MTRATLQLRLVAGTQEIIKRTNLRLHRAVRPMDHLEPIYHPMETSWNWSWTRISEWTVSSMADNLTPGFARPDRPTSTSGRSSTVRIEEPSLGLICYCCQVPVKTVRLKNR